MLNDLDKNTRGRNSCISVIYLTWYFSLIHFGPFDKIKYKYTQDHFKVIMIKVP